MRFLTPSLIILTLFIIGGAIFKTTAPVRCDTILPSDSIFVLTGDVRRIPFALRKFNEANAAKLYIIGAGGNLPQYTDSRIITEQKSKTTYQNTLSIQKIADANGLNRLVLITTVDHFNRAQYLLRNQLSDIEIVACPVPLNGMPVTKRLQRWTTEYIKYIGTLVGIRES